MIGEQLVSWGKLKASGDNTMYPKVSRSAAPAAIRGMHRTAMQLSYTLDVSCLH